MANEQPIGNKRFLTDLDIRIFMRDTDPSANLLLDDLEFTAEELRTASTLAVDKWNDTPPFLQNFSADNFPFRSSLMLGTCANLLFIAANRYRRNDLQYNIGGGAVNDQARHTTYDEAGQRMWTQYLQWITHSKRAMNMEQGFGVIDGGMSWIR
jgi:hypothetical protein